MAFIELKNINKTFFPNTNREHYALKNINLVINKGDFITIIGGNGAGKSTLFNAISGVFPLDSGTITIDEKDISFTKEFERAKYISRVFQNPLDNTAPRMTVAENMALAFNRGEKRTLKFSRNKENLILFENLLKNLNLGLEQKINTEIGVLSGGQRQCLSLIMATLNRPDILLLDEHTAALDPQTSEIILEKTKEIIEKNNITSLMITHNMQDAITYGNRLIMLHAGEIIFDIKGEEKKKLTVEKLLEMFKTKDAKLSDKDIF